MSEASSTLSTIDQSKARRREFEVMMESTLAEFQRKMHELTRLVECWLHDTGVRITASDVYIKINLPFVHKYPLSSINFEYAGREITLLPKYIFLAGGAKGVISFLCGGAHPKCFTIFMEVPQREHEGWIICSEGERSIDGVVLTEKEFFRTLHI